MSFNGAYLVCRWITIVHFYELPPELFGILPDLHGRSGHKMIGSEAKTETNVRNGTRKWSPHGSQFVRVGMELNYIHTKYYNIQIWTDNILYTENPECVRMYLGTAQSQSCRWTPRPPGQQSASCPAPCLPSGRRCSSGSHSPQPGRTCPQYRWHSHPHWDHCSQIRIHAINDG